MRRTCEMIRSGAAKRMRVNMRFIKPALPLTAILSVALSAAVFGQDVTGALDGPRRMLRVVASGRFTGAREIQQVVTWRTRGAAHLAIEEAGSRRQRVLFQADGANSESRVDFVRTSDLNDDGVPEIASLWWRPSGSTAALRVFHWDRRQNAFVELQFEDELNDVRSYRFIRSGGIRSAGRLVVETRSGAGARRRSAGAEYELRGSTLIRVRGGRDVTTQAESGIEGQALIGPVRPGPQKEGAPGSAPYKTTLVVWRVSDGQEVKRVETGSDGRFRVALPPGDYRIGPPPRTGRFLPRGSEETVTVAPGKFVSVTINFDSGMR